VLGLPGHSVLCIDTRQLCCRYQLLIIQRGQLALHAVLSYAVARLQSHNRHKLFMCMLARPWSCKTRVQNMLMPCWLRVLVRTQLGPLQSTTMYSPIHNVSKHDKCFCPQARLFTQGAQPVHQAHFDHLPRRGPRAAPAPAPPRRSALPAGCAAGAGDSPRLPRMRMCPPHSVTFT
jgi:hypothetical protein